MGMNKKEKLYVEQLEKELALFKANKTTQETLPDVPPPSGGVFGELTKGWLFNAYSKMVNKACSSYVSHNPHRDDKTSSQNPVHLYSTELLATKAMRYQVELHWLQELAKIDTRISKLEQGE